MNKKIYGIFSGIFLASFCLSGQNVKTVKVPAVTVAVVPVKTVKVPETEIPSAMIPETGKTKTDEPSAVVPEAADRNTPLVQGKTFTAVKKRLFRDQRGLLHDRTANSSNAAFMKWVKIFENYQEQDHPVYPIPEGIRMIAEVQYTPDLSRLPAALDFYIKEGYNSVLYAITGKETPAEAENVCKIIREKGLKIFFTFSPIDHDGELSASVFPDPDSLSDLLRITAVYADGFLLHWRRTCSHYFLHDPAWDDWMIRTVRSSKSTIPVIGEFYQGTTAASEKFTVTINAPSGTSGVILNGAGHQRLTTRFVMKVAELRTKLPVLAVILGEKPQYLKNTEKSFAEHLKIKQELEKQYLKYGAAGTITLHSDYTRDNLASWQAPAITEE